jgi:hypothetical protein
MMPATAAAHVWPYPHRTLAEIDAAETEWAEALALARLSSKGPACRLDRAAGLSRDRGVNRPPEAVRSPMPDTSCPSCGARGWCGHGGRIAA